MPLLKIENLCKSFNEQKVLQNINLEIKKENLFLYWVIVAVVKAHFCVL